MQTGTKKWSTFFFENGTETERNRLLEERKLFNSENEQFWKCVLENDAVTKAMYTFLLDVEMGGTKKVKEKTDVSQNKPRTTCIHKMERGKEYPHGSILYWNYIFKVFWICFSWRKLHCFVVL